MKKTLIIVIAAGAAVLAYLAIRKKYSNKHQQPDFQPRPEYKKHHLTNAFTNAKKHTVHTQ